MYRIDETLKGLNQKLATLKEEITQYPIKENGYKDDAEINTTTSTDGK